MSRGADGHAALAGGVTQRLQGPRRAASDELGGEVVASRGTLAESSRHEVRDRFDGRATPGLALARTGGRRPATWQQTSRRASQSKREPHDARRHGETPRHTSEAPRALDWCSAARAGRDTRTESAPGLDLGPVQWFDFGTVADYLRAVVSAIVLTWPSAPERSTAEAPTASTVGAWIQRSVDEGSE